MEVFPVFVCESCGSSQKSHDTVPSPFFFPFLK
uniref:Uncharacterized protein n=1 Tax=Rhizophora mucronata TaxID=61149 RepID=A0A2P2ISZ0_RHIMU